MKTRQKMIRLDENVYERAEKLCKAYGYKSMSRMATDALDRLVTRLEKRNEREKAKALRR